MLRKPAINMSFWPGPTIATSLPSGETVLPYKLRENPGLRSRRASQKVARVLRLESPKHGRTLSRDLQEFSYVPDVLWAEIESLKLYLQSYRSRGIRGAIASVVVATH